MELKKVKLVYFSATYTTRDVLRRMADALGAEREEYDVTQAAPPVRPEAEAGDLFIFGAPVYAGRIPPQAADAFKAFSGQGVPAVVVAVYGNRDYDDALVEMTDLVGGNGFTVVAAVAMVAQHSIFPVMGQGRPDADDVRFIRDFGRHLSQCLGEVTDWSQVRGAEPKGNRPYKQASTIPLKPSGSNRCNVCGKCVRLCPVQAIPAQHPRHTDKEKCISCGRCVAVCPGGARRFRGLLYWVVRRKFAKAYSARKTPEVFWGKMGD